MGFNPFKINSTRSFETSCTNYPATHSPENKNPHLTLVFIRFTIKTPSIPEHPVIVMNSLIA